MNIYFKSYDSGFLHLATHSALQLSWQRLGEFITFSTIPTQRKKYANPCSHIFIIAMLNLGNEGLDFVCDRHHCCSRESFYTHDWNNFAFVTNQCYADQ